MKELNRFFPVCWNLYFCEGGHQLCNNCLAFYSCSNPLCNFWNGHILFWGLLCGSTWFLYIVEHSLNKHSFNGWCSWRDFAIYITIWLELQNIHQNNTFLTLYEHSKIFLFSQEAYKYNIKGSRWDVNKRSESR